MTQQRPVKIPIRTPETHDVVPIGIPIPIALVADVDHALYATLRSSGFGAHDIVIATKRTDGGVHFEHWQDERPDAIRRRDRTRARRIR